MTKFKLIKMGSKTISNTIEGCILDYIKDKDVEGEYVNQQKIIDFVKSECHISSKKIRDILQDLVKRRKISTFYDKPNRYYGPPKIPLPIKACVSMVTIILASYLVIDIAIPQNILRDIIYLRSPIGDTSIIKINIFPFAIIGIICVLVISILWYYDYRKIYK